MRIVTGGTSHPVKNVWVRIFFNCFYPEPFCPLHTLLVIDAPGILGPLHAAKCGLQLGRKFARDHYLMAANVDDIEHWLILDGADFDARAAGGAGPQCLRG